MTNPYTTPTARTFWETQPQEIQDALNSTPHKVVRVDDELGASLSPSVGESIVRLRDEKTVRAEQRRQAVISAKKSQNPLRTLRTEIKKCNKRIGMLRDAHQDIRHAIEQIRKGSGSFTSEQDREEAESIRDHLKATLLFNELRRDVLASARDEYIRNGKLSRVSEKSTAHERTLKIARALSDPPDGLAGDVEAEFYGTKSTFLKWAGHVLGMSAATARQALEDTGCFAKSVQGSSAGLEETVLLLKRYANKHPSDFKNDA